MKFLSGLLLVALCAPVVHGQHVRGIVIDSTSKEPLREVMVSLMDTTGQLISAIRSRENGRFQMRVAQSPIAILARAIGFAPLTSDWMYATPEDTLEVTLRLTRTAMNLTPVVIAASRDSLLRNGKLFGMRLSSIGGSVMSPAEALNAAGSASNYLDVVQRMQAQRFRVACQDRSCGTRCLIYIPANTCSMVFVDDVLTTPEAAADLALPHLIHHIIALRPVEAGVLFGTRAASGVLLIYTRAWAALHR